VSRTISAGRADDASDEAGEQITVTRGGWIPSGTSAERRVAHSERGNARGARTRRQIIDAARRVFERDGYLDVGVADIVKEAGLAHGSFYTYFPSKIEVFRVVTAEVAEVVGSAVTRRAEGEQNLDPVDALSRSNLRYFRVYEANAKIYALLEQVGHSDAESHEESIARRRAHIARIARLIRHWQAQGFADPSVAPEPTAAALLSMVTNVCYWLFVDHDSGFDIETSAAAVNEAWIRAVGLRRRPNRKWLEAQSARSAG
jgi:AcrR family transcriptional regulator